MQNPVQGKRRAGPQSASNHGWLMAALHLLLVFVSETCHESLCGLSQLSGDRSLFSRWPSEKWLMFSKIPLPLLFSACHHDFGVFSSDMCSLSNYSFWLCTSRAWKALSFKGSMCHCFLCSLPSSLWISFHLKRKNQNQQLSNQIDDKKKEKKEEKTPELSLQCIISIWKLKILSWLNKNLQIWARSFQGRQRFMPGICKEHEKNTSCRY